MSCQDSTNINKTFIIEPNPVTGGSITFSACTALYTNFIASCSGNTFINLGTDTISFGGALSASTISASTVSAGTINGDFYYSGGTLLRTAVINIISGQTVGIFLSLSGGTLTGGMSGTTISANTISATTFYGDGSNLTGISTQDTSITGATFNNNILLLTNNTGGTFNVLINNLSGLTINGNLNVTNTSNINNIVATAVTTNLLTSKTGSTEWFKVLENGEIQIFGGNATNSQIGVRQKSFSTSTILDIYNNDFSKLLFRITDNGSDGHVLIGNSTIDINSYSNNVGIGLSAGAGKLKIKADAVGQDILTIAPAAGQGAVYFNNDINNHPFFYLQNSAGTTTNVSITSSGNSYFNAGNIGINIVSPQDLLHINGGTLRINDTTYGAGKIAISDANGRISFSSATELYLLTGTSSSLIINTVSATSITGITLFSKTAYTNTLSATSITANTIQVNNRSYNVLTPQNATTIIDLSLTNVFDLTLTADTVFSLSNIQAGQTTIIGIHQPPTTAYTYSLSGSTILWAGGTTPEITTTSGKTDIYTLIVLSGNTVYGSAIPNF